MAAFGRKMGPSHQSPQLARSLADNPLLIRIGRDQPEAVDLSGPDQLLQQDERCPIIAAVDHPTIRLYE